MEARRTNSAQHSLSGEGEGMTIIPRSQTVIFAFLFKNSEISHSIILTLKQDFQVNQKNDVFFQLFAEWHSNYSGPATVIAACKELDVKFADWMNESVVADCVKHWPMMSAKSIEKYLRESFLTFTKNEIK